MSELYPTDIELNALSGTDDSATGVHCPQTGKTPWYMDFQKTYWRMLRALGLANSLRVFKDGDLTFGVRAGRIQNGTNTMTIAASSGHALTNNASNYIYYTVSGSTASLVCGTSGYPAASSTPYLPLATIVCAGGTYTFDDIVDSRGSAFLHLINAMTAVQANVLVGGPASNADDLHTHEGIGGGTVGAPTDAGYWLASANGALPNGIVPSGANGITVNPATGQISQTFGADGGHAAAGNDSRFADAASHAAGQGMEVHGLGSAATCPADTFASATDLTSHTNATGTNVHGLGSAAMSNTGDFTPAAHAASTGTNVHGLGSAATLTATTSVASPGSDSNIPTEKAVRTALASAGGSSETIARKLSQLSLTSTTQTAYTCPTSYCAQVSVNLANIDSTSQCAFNLWVVDSSGSVTAQIANGVTVNRNNSFSFGKINLEAGDRILLSAGGSNQFDSILSIREKLLTSAQEFWKMSAVATLGSTAATIATGATGKAARFVLMAGNILNTTAAANITFKVQDASGSTTLTLGNQLSIGKNQYLPLSLDIDGDDGIILEVNDLLQAYANGTGTVSCVAGYSEWPQ